ncbi:MAG: hypothetical protein U9R74_00730 [Pseudomonadota bacterium]|nr:hypothetical protein [Pseudomonadota bacterium]
MNVSRTNRPFRIAQLFALIVLLPGLSNAVEATIVNYKLEGVIERSVVSTLQVGASYSATLSFDPANLVSSPGSWGGLRYLPARFAFRSGAANLKGDNISITIDNDTSAGNDVVRIDGRLRGSFQANLRVNLVNHDNTLFDSNAFPDPFPTLADFDFGQLLINTSTTNHASLDVFEPATHANEIYLDFETLADGVTRSIERQELKDEYAGSCVTFRNFDPADESRSAEFTRRFRSTNTVVQDNHRFVNPPPGPNFNITADFSIPVSRVSADVSIAVGDTITMTGFDESGVILGSDTSIVSPSCCSTLVDTVTLSGVGNIFTVLWETSAPRAAIPVIDNLRYSTVIPCGQTTHIINIDIKPWKDPAQSNTFDLTKGGRFWVAILSGVDFDALQVDPDSVRFGRGEARVLRYRIRDVNRDGFDDLLLLLRFKNRHAKFECGDTEASLYAETYTGRLVSGTDSIRTVKCKPLHPRLPAPKIDPDYLCV